MPALVPVRSGTAEAPAAAAGGVGGGALGRVHALTSRGVARGGPLLLLGRLLAANLKLQFPTSISYNSCAQLLLLVLF